MLKFCPIGIARSTWETAFRSRNLFDQIAPAVTGTIDDVTLTQGTGVQTIQAAQVFTGTPLVYSVNSVSGVTINAANGVLSVDTANTLALSSIVVTATNSEGSAQAGFSLTVNAAVAAPGNLTYGADTPPGTAPLAVTAADGLYHGGTLRVLSGELTIEPGQTPAVATGVDIDGNAVDVIADAANFGTETEFLNATTAASAADQTIAYTLLGNPGDVVWSGATNISAPMSSTEITHAYDLRDGATDSYAFDGGYFHIKSATSTPCRIFGEITVSGTSVLMTDVSVGSAKAIEREFYEPETTQDITAVVKGVTTQITIPVETAYRFEQLDIGDKIVLSGFTGDFAALNGTNGGETNPTTFAITAVDSSTNTVTVDADSSSFADWDQNPGAQIQGSLTGLSFVPDTITLQGGANIVLGEGALHDVSDLTPGFWPNFIACSGAGDVVLAGCESNGEVLGLGSGSFGRSLWVIGTKMVGVLDFLAVRPNRVSNLKLSRYPQFAVSDITVDGGGLVTVTTTAAHGLVAGDSIVMENVGGATEANDFFWVRDVTATTMILQKLDHDADAYIDADGSAWGTYTSGGDLYGPVYFRGALRRNVQLTPSAGLERIKAAHTDGIQIGSPFAETNSDFPVTDNAMILKNLIAQGMLLDGGGGSLAYFKGDVKGNLLVLSAAMGIRGPIYREGDGEVSFNTLVRWPDIVDAGGAVVAQVNAVAEVPLDRNLGGSNFDNINASAILPFPNDNIALASADVENGTIFPDAGFALTDGSYLPLAVDSVDNTLPADELLAEYVRLFTPAATHDYYGLTADPDSPHYIAPTSGTLNPLPDPLAISFSTTNPSAQNLSDQIRLGDAETLIAVAAHTYAGNGVDSTGSTFFYDAAGDVGGAGPSEELTGQLHLSGGRRTAMTAALMSAPTPETGVVRFDPLDGSDVFSNPGAAVVLTYYGPTADQSTVFTGSAPTSDVSTLTETVTAAAGERVVAFIAVNRNDAVDTLANDYGVTGDFTVLPDLCGNTGTANFGDVTYITAEIGNATAGVKTLTLTLTRTAAVAVTFMRIPTAV